MKLKALMFLLTFFIYQNVIADSKSSEKVFEVCGSCHTLDKEVTAVGPSLYGVIGRKAGTLQDYRYSPALKRSGIVWDKNNLDLFLTDPQKAIPSNRMPFAGVTDPQERTKIIEFIQEKFR